MFLLTTTTYCTVLQYSTCTPFFTVLSSTARTWYCDHYFFSLVTNPNINGAFWGTVQVVLASV